MFESMIPRLIKYMDEHQLEKAIYKTRKEIENVVKDLNFVEAARLRDEMLEMEKAATGS